MKEFLKTLDKTESLADSSLLDFDAQFQSLSHRLQTNLNKLHDHLPASEQKRSSDLMMGLRELLALAAVLRARCELETSTANVLPADVRYQVKERAPELRTRIEEASTPEGAKAELERELEVAPDNYGRFLQSLSLLETELSEDQQANPSP